MRHNLFSKFLMLSIFALIKVCTAQKIDVYSRPLQSERSRDYDVIHYRIKLRFDEKEKTFWGENTITMSPFKDGFTRCVLDAETFTVTSVKDDDGKALNFEQPPHHLIVLFQRPYDYGDTLAPVSYCLNYIVAGNTRHI